MYSGMPPKQKYLFTVDLMLEAETNGRALELLLHLLNNPNIQDYQVKQGIELGKKIEQALKEAIVKPKGLKTPSPSTPPPANIKPAVPEKAPKGEISSNDPYHSVWEQMKRFQENNTLVRLSIIKEKGIKLSIPGRIISTDPASNNVSVYHVDEKKVYLLKINEIDDFETR